MCGISITDYWSLTLADMMVYVESYNTRRKQELRQNAANVYQTALLTASFVNAMMCGKECPSFEQVYPELEDEAEKKAREKREIEIYREQLKAYAVQHNKRRS